MSIAEINALLYLPGHGRQQLERALRIPALSPGWRGSFRAMLEQKPGLAPADVSGRPPAWRGFRPLRVMAKARESADVFSLALAPADDRPLAAPLAGQFIVLRLQAEREAPPLLRSYSLSGAPEAARYRLGIKLETAGAAGTYLDREVRIGDTLQASAPRGSFTLEPGERPLVLASAGIGVTPVLAMLHALAASGAARPVWWLYGARNAEHHPFAAEARSLLQRLPHARSRIWYSRPARDDRSDARGHMAVAELAELQVPRQADFYLCGPSAFMRALRAQLSAWGVAPERVHVERFGSGESGTPGIADVPHRPVQDPGGAAPRTGPLVSFARSNLSTDWDAKYRSLLELAEACHVPVRWSCRTGVCHRCESGLVAGAVAYRPDPLEAPAEGNVLICCSRPVADVVIDL
jgi:ferredoxin-NADP reductase/ferredoxin